MLKNANIESLGDKDINKIEKNIKFANDLKRENEEILNSFDDLEIYAIFDDTGATQKQIKRLKALVYKNNCKIDKLFRDLENYDFLFDTSLKYLLKNVEDNLQKEFSCEENDIKLNLSLIMKQLGSHYAFNKDGDCIPGSFENEYLYGYEFMDAGKRMSFVLPSINVKASKSTSAQEIYEEDPKVNLLHMGWFANKNDIFNSKIWNNVALDVVEENFNLYCSSQNDKSQNIK